jgi:hypothetical protein
MHKSILVGDVGSTKSSWCFDAAEEKTIHLDGYNPLFHSPAARVKLFETLHQQSKNVQFSDIWYYGAGIIDHHIAEEVRQQLMLIYPLSQIHVASDLLGAAIAACGYEPGTVAILGTGSHAAVFNGHKIIRQATSLGYILGDEGGGCDIGKALLQAYFYNELPEAFSLEMGKKLPSGRTGFINELKNSSAPNQYLAEFARVAVLYQEHPWIKDMVSSRFKLFVKRHLIPLALIGPVHIVGSIGCIFAGLLKNELELAGLTLGELIKEPIHRLFEIHKEHGQKHE